jgi:hypothetical protein
MEFSCPFVSCAGESRLGVNVPTLNFCRNLFMRHATDIKNF